MSLFPSFGPTCRQSAATSARGEAAICGSRRCSCSQITGQSADPKGWQRAGLLAGVPKKAGHRLDGAESRCERRAGDMSAVPRRYMREGTERTSRASVQVYTGPVSSSGAWIHRQRRGESRWHGGLQLAEGVVVVIAQPRRSLSCAQSLADKDNDQKPRPLHL